MKTFNLATILVGLLALSPFAFADAAANHYNWSGFYAGLNAGAVEHTLNMTDVQAASFNATIEQVTNPKFTAGLQLGYRHQLDLNGASGVFGGEFSANFANAEFKKQYGSQYALYNLSSKNELNSIYLLQLTGGVAAEKTLLFLAAGLSYTHLSGYTTNTDGTPFFNSFSVAQSVFGTAIGAGIEYAVNDAVSARLKVDFITPNAYSTSDDVGNSYQITNRIVQGVLGININLEKAGWIKL